MKGVKKRVLGDSQRDQPFGARNAKEVRDDEATNGTGAHVRHWITSRESG
ncbi:MAG: hypothetical protein HZB26_21600 [Candidatus Hydrogenedentes bacterium]|nr:hypothetical protein [Candidatus Hydrogenedentota bacterium]